MTVITAKILAENCIYTMKQRKKDKTTVSWTRIKDLNEKLDIKNIFDLIHKEIKGKFKDGASKEQIKKYKRYRSEFGKGVKHIYAREDVVIPVIMACRS